MHLFIWWSRDVLSIVLGCYYIRLLLLLLLLLLFGLVGRLSSDFWCFFLLKRFIRLQLKSSVGELALIYFLRLILRRISDYCLSSPCYSLCYFVLLCLLSIYLSLLDLYFHKSISFHSLFPPPSPPTFFISWFLFRWFFWVCLFLFLSLLLGSGGKGLHLDALVLPFWLSGSASGSWEDFQPGIVADVTLFHLIFAIFFRDGITFFFLFFLRKGEGLLSNRWIRLYSFLYFFLFFPLPHTPAVQSYQGSVKNFIRTSE